MANKHHRYEAIVKLSNGAAPQYHNINTGLLKFDAFVDTKFKGQWLYYTARRISNKEIVGTFKNEIIIYVKGIRIYLAKQRNDNDTGYFVRVPFKRDNLTINRNLFFSDNVILEKNDDSIVVNEIIFTKATVQAIDDLIRYYNNKGHIVASNEIVLSDFENEKILISRKQGTRTKPLTDYP